MKLLILQELRFGDSENKCTLWYEVDNYRYKRFFDIISIGALPEFFALDYDISTTDFVVKEMLESDQKVQIESFIRDKKLNVFKLTADEAEEIRNFATKRFFKGITDKTVLWKSHQLKCPLLTGDKKLRNEAEDLKIKVHGSIWVINELVEKNIVTKAKGGGNVWITQSIPSNSMVYQKSEIIIKNSNFPKPITFNI